MRNLIRLIENAQTVSLPLLGETPFWIEPLAGIQREIAKKLPWWTWNTGGCWAFAHALHQVIGGSIVLICEHDEDEGQVPNHALVRKNGTYYDFKGVVDVSRLMSEMTNQHGTAQELVDDMECPDDLFLSAEQSSTLSDVLSELRIRSTR